MVGCGLDMSQVINLQQMYFKHFNHALAFIRTGVAGGKLLCGSAYHFQHIYSSFFTYNKAYKFTCTKQIVTDT